MSAGQLFDLIMPAAFAVSALISTWVLASARKRFRLHYAFALALGMLFLPLIVFPVYLVLMMWREKIGPPTRWRYLLPLLYAAIALSAIFVYFYFDGRSVDAHLARATQANSWRIRIRRSASIERHSRATTIHTRTNCSGSNLQ